MQEERRGKLRIQTVILNKLLDELKGMIRHKTSLDVDGTIEGNMRRQSNGTIHKLQSSRSSARFCVRMPF